MITNLAATDLSRASTKLTSRRLALAFIALLVFFGVSSHARAATVLGRWLPIFEGIDHAVGTNTSASGGFPDLMVIYAARVNLTDSNIQFYASPRISSGYSVDSHEVGGYCTSNFLKNHGLQLAVNANYFHDPGSDDTESPSYTESQGSPFDLIGLAISQGQVVSPQDSFDYTASFFFASNNAATFIPTNWPARSTAGAYTAVTGLYPVLLNNLNIGSNYLGSGDAIHQVNPRTAFGLSSDRRYLYILVIDGRQSGYSDGALDWETAAWLKLLGASDGANMDGGGSSCLVISGSTGEPIELNRDSASAAYGVERTDGSSFGIFAKPTPGFINNVNALADDTAATITWTTISNASSQVFYGATTNFNLSTPLESALVSNHAVLLTNLTPSASYYFSVYSQADGALYASSNFVFTTTNYVSSQTLLDFTNSWTYEINPLDGTNWTVPSFNDSDWTGSGAGFLWADARGPNPDIPQLATQMPLDPETGYPYVTYYFRTHFTYTNSLSNVSLLFTTYIDDGAVFYLNGPEVYRLRMPAAPTVITSETLASGYPCSGDATCPDSFSLLDGAASNFVQGDNVMAVEVHNYNAVSPDITFGMSLVASIPLAAAPMVGIGTSNGAVTISWSRGGFLLQQAPSPTGPWSNVTGPVVSSPFVITPAISNQFFRLYR